MITWMRLAMSFFVFVLVLFGFVYFFGPNSTRDELGGSPGQLSIDHTVTSPGEQRQPAQAQEP